MTPDVNVLVAASRSDHPHHTIARSWLEQAVVAAASGSALILMPVRVSGAGSTRHARASIHASRNAFRRDEPSPHESK